MKAFQTTRMVEQPCWACHDAEHAHATEPLANACIREQEAEPEVFAEFAHFEALADEVVPVKKAKRGKRGV